MTIINKKDQSLREMLGELLDVTERIKAKIDSLEKDGSPVALGVVKKRSKVKPIHVTIMGGTQSLQLGLVKSFIGRVEFNFIVPNAFAKTAAMAAMGTHVLCHSKYEGPTAIAEAKRACLTFQQMKAVGLNGYTQHINKLLALANQPKP